MGPAALPAGHLLALEGDDGVEANARNMLMGRQVDGIRSSEPQRMDGGPGGFLEEEARALGSPGGKCLH